MKTIFAIVFAAFSGIAFAQAPPCMPGGVCCITGNCGTLEQFKRNATIVCLKADAIENKNLPQSIELSGRCIAAHIMAERVEATQKANAADHQRALEAQRKLHEMGVAATPVPRASNNNALAIANQEARAVILECRSKRLRGELKTYVESVQCANPRIIQAFRAANYRYPDLIDSFAKERTEIAEELDAKRMTEAQAQVENARMFSELVEAERQRDAKRK